MQQIIDQISDHLVSLVTSEKSEYTPNELLKSGIPSFVVERIRLFLEDKVKEEIKTEGNTWFDTESKLVIQAFEDYRRSAISSSHIPKPELYKVIQTVVNDIILVFIEPRKNMAEYLFREDDELPIHEVESRCATLTIYKHFGTAIPLYMRKRNLDTLTKERCKLLIHKLDEKLVSSYSANDWAQKLEQLFELFGGEVEPRLLATFFEDKGLYGMANKFEGRSDLLSKAAFIDIISSEGFVDFTSVTDKTGSLDDKNEKIATEEAEKLSEQDESEQSLIESFFGNYEYVPGDGSVENSSLADQYSEGGLSDDEMSELLSDIASEGVIGLGDDFDEGNSLNELFSLGSEGPEEEVLETSEEIAESIKKDPDAEINTEFRDNLISILDQAKSSFDGIDGGEEADQVQEEEPVKDEVEEVLEVESPDLADALEETSETEAAKEEEQEEGEEEPMWAQFINQDQMDVLMGGERSAEREPDISETFEDEIEVEEAFEEQSIFEEEEIATPTVSVSDIRQDLEDMLESRKKEFIDVIFKKSSKDFDKALDTLSTFDSWKETSSFIQKEIFAKNEVDMFSGATVDFTDRMHQYFNKPRNT